MGWLCRCSLNWSLWLIDWSSDHPIVLEKNTQIISDLLTTMDAIMTERDFNGIIIPTIILSSIQIISKQIDRRFITVNSCFFLSLKANYGTNPVGYTIVTMSKPNGVTYIRH